MKQQRRLWSFGLIGVTLSVLMGASTYAHGTQTFSVSGIVQGAPQETPRSPQTLAAPTWDKMPTPTLVRHRSSQKQDRFSLLDRFNRGDSGDPDEKESDSGNPPQEDPDSGSPSEEDSDSGTSDTSASLSWDAVTEEPVDGYKVYMGTASGEYGTPIDVGDQTSHTVTDLEAGNTYYFAVTAHNAAGESDFSNEVSKEIPAEEANEKEPEPTSCRLSYDWKNRQWIQVCK